ncbi:NADAR family protein [Arcicella rosea]|uniref:Putative NAD-dependent protein-ADP-ribosyltransferase YbiA (DUF1768 family) n=1 Tax=Arcicella rosea TaxID=502909 RepID=A0A841ET31_9BACT|nr:NADAR family protein [Arcicella rosea]MBB6003828.1 putative NAD-dependent protein-ADP-ribosyltransferase YbiA (DUF1768 family) [Arcicella rosea]
MIYSLDKSKVIDISGQYKYNKSTIQNVNSNQEKAKSKISEYKLGGIFDGHNYEDLFSFSGSIKITSLNSLNYPSSEFIKQKVGRYFLKKCKFGEEYYLRGPRYVIALDPHYSVIQKLDILIEDINDSLEFLKKYNVNTNQFYSISVVLDYLKNSLVTLFNSLIHQEKLGNYNLSNKNYQLTRSKLLEALQLSVFAFYLSLCDKLNQKILIELVSSITPNLLESVSNKIKSDFESFVFSSKSLTRPEASHPLILFSYAINICSKYGKIDFVFGLPSGSTEISCLINQVSKNFFNNPEIRLLLIPVSIHSIKDIGEVQEKSKQHINLNRIFPTFICAKSKCIGLVVDDNSASGRTIEKMSTLVKNHFIGLKVICTVVEADLRRIAMNLKLNDEKKPISHPSLFKYSTGILPISQIISPKFDLKELQERRLLYQYYKNKTSQTLAEKIVLEVIADSIENRIEDTYFSYDDSNSIKLFKHTFLSNFYSVDFFYRGRKYSSVEQAYLRLKFNDKVLNELSNSQKADLNEILKIKGIGDIKKDFVTAFYDFNLPAGVLKRWSNKLKEWGIGDIDWDSKRLYIMTELLILKFSNPILLAKLLETKDKYLIEGNEWNDTFWGVCNNRGRNYLGRILMNIRERILNGQLLNNS